MENFSLTNESIIGNIPENKKDDILREREQMFFNGSKEGVEKRKFKERQKTPDDIKMIEIANKLTNEVCAKYGCPEFDVPAERIHITEAFDDQNAEVYFALGRDIQIADRSDRIVFASNLAHGMVHLKSRNTYRAYETENNNFALKEHSLGLDVSSEKRRFFINLNEAITGEIIREITMKMMDDDFFAKETKETARIIGENPHAVMKNGDPLFDEDTYFAREANNNFLKLAVNKLKKKRKIEIHTNRFTYPKEREILNIMVDKIFANKDILSKEYKNEFDFNTRDDVFDIFAKSMFDGDLRRVIKLTDLIFGLGTTQRLLRYEKKEKSGRPFNDVDGQLQFVKDLKPKPKNDKPK